MFPRSHHWALFTLKFWKHVWVTPLGYQLNGTPPHYYGASCPLQVSLLTKVQQGTLSLAEMKSEATELKQMQALKKTFTRLTNTDSWEEAVTNFSTFATEEQLRKFLSIDVKKNITKFCGFLYESKKYRCKYKRKWTRWRHSLQVMHGVCSGI